MALFQHTISMVAFLYDISSWALSYKRHCNIKLINVGVKHSDWLKNVEHPIRVLKLSTVNLLMALVLKMKKLTEPRKIDGDFFSKVFPDVVQRLVLVPLAPPCPIVVQDLADVQLGRGSTLARMLKWTLKFEKYIIYNLCGNFFKRDFQHFDTM